MKFSNIWWVHGAALIAAAGVVIHVGAVFGGPSWFTFFNAPPRVVASAPAGTWLAPLSALTIAALMGICALYACSVIGWVRQPQLQRVGLAGMAAVCLLRALLLPPLAIGHLELRNTFEVVRALMRFAAGLGSAVGFRITAEAAFDSKGGYPNDSH